MAETTGEDILRQFRKAAAEMRSMPEWRREAIREAVRQAGERRAENPPVDFRPESGKGPLA